ncbi:MAG: nucleotide exchange factor GrpE [Candidatus Taylorbacteria bacterium]|nr:nucleotide exchange factor GrpE [Candidatus Taylorbacteria bacterium]
MDEDKNVNKAGDDAVTSDDVTIESDETLDDSVLAEESAIEAVKKLKAKLKEAVDEKQKYLDGWQRDKAEFLNARKRDKEDLLNYRKFATEDVVTEMLSVLQSFEMAFANKEAWEKADKNWRTGVEYIYNQTKGILEKQGLKEISPLGESFDPMRDEAIEIVPVTDEKENNKIIQIIQKGYTYNGKMIVAPKVKVGELKK